MNNINIKAKKTRTLNNIKYIEMTSKFEPLYANIYCVMASKRTNQLSKNDLKRDLASLYDARLSVTQVIDNNIICIRYTLTSILDQFLPTPISSDVDNLLSQVLEPIEFTDQEITLASEEISLYVKNYFDNKQNIASSRLSEQISCDELQLTMEEVIEFYNNPDLAAIRHWIKNLYKAPTTVLNFNDGEEHFKQEYSALDFKYKQYQPADDLVIDLNLDQTYIAIGYKLSSHNITLNNIINLIFGGGVYSKLFKVVREELSLSYNIRSQLKSDDLIFVCGGINNEKVDFALNEIDKQLEILRNDDFSHEFELAKTNYIENIKRSQNSEMAYISMYGTNFLTHSKRSHQSIISEIEALNYEVVKQEICNIKKLSTVYVK